MKAPETKVDYPQVSKGVHQAIIYAMFDIGTQKGEYKGEEKHTRQIVVCFEVPEERITIDEKDLPMALSKFYTFSMGEKANLRKHIQLITGEELSNEQALNYPIETILGLNCLITVDTNKKGKSFISSITRTMKGMALRKSENEHVFYSLDEHGLNIPEKTPKWVRGFIEKSPEWLELLDSLNSDLSQDSDEETDLEPF